MRRDSLVAAALVTVFSAAGVAVPAAASAAATAAAAAKPANIIRNPGAEAGSGSADGSTVPVPSWTVKKGSSFTAVQYGASGGFPTSASPGPKSRGANFFAGGPDARANAQTATQTDGLAAYAGVIAAGATFTLEGYLGGFATQADHVTVTVTWENSSGVTLGTAVIGPVTQSQRHGVTGLLHRSLTGSVPAGSAKALVTIKCVRNSGAYNDGYADNLSLTIVAAS
jgi:hypothetical protein